MKCPNCETIFPDHFFKCPSCQYSVQANHISLQKKDGLAFTTSGQIAQMKNEKLLNQLLKVDGLDESNLSSHLTIVDLDNSLENITAGTVSRLEKLEDALLGKNDEMMLQGIQISNLLQGQADKIEMIKTGIKFLKYKHYKEAVEWWSINRDNLEPTERSMYLLLLVFESYTYLLSGNKTKAEEIQNKIRNHPLYANYKQ